MKNTRSFKKVISYVLVASIIWSQAILGATPGAHPEVINDGPKIGEILPGLSTPAGNSIYVADSIDGRLRVMAIEHGQLVEGSFENNKVTWDTQLPTQQEINPNERPSRLKGLFDWKSSSSSELRDDMRLNESGEIESRSIGQKIKGGAAYMGQAAAYYFIAMGLIAAGKVLMFHGGNPMALKRYMDTLTDPVGYVALAGFMIAAYPFFKQLSKPKNAPTIRYFPWFAAGLISGGIVSNLVVEMANDPNVIKCMFLDKVDRIANGETFDRDLNACDRAFDKWAIADKLAPYLGTVLAAGTMYYGVTAGSAAIWAQSGMTARIAALKLPKIPTFRGGNLVSAVVINVGHMLLFLGMHQIAKNALGIENGIREQLMMRYSFQTHELGATLEQSFNLLKFQLSELEGNKFRDVELIGRVVAQQKHVANQLYAWRMLQLQPTKFAADQWAEKLAKFQITFNNSYKLYEDALKRIANERANPNLPTDDETRLNWEYLNKNYLTDPKMNYSGDFEDPEDWEYVKANNLLEFAVASMACGPDLQNKKHERPWSPITNFIMREKAKKGSVIRNTGFADEFRPPSITKFNREESVCNQNMLGLKIKLPPQKYQVLAVVSDEKSKPTQVKSKDILDYVKGNINPEIIGPNNQLKFDEWWTKYVIAEIQPTYDLYTNQYSAIIRGPLQKALTNSNYNCLNTSSKLDHQNMPSTLKGSFSQVKCSKPGQLSLAKGVINSLRDEKNHYISLIREIAQTTIEKQSATKFLEKIELLNQHIESGFSHLVANLGKAVDVNELKNKYLLIQKDAIEHIPKPPALSQNEIREGVKNLIKKITDERDVLLKKAELDQIAVAKSMNSASVRARSANSPTIGASRAAANFGISFNGQMVAIDELLKNADFLTRLEETVKMDAELKFYSKHPELALLRQNLLQVDSVYEQVRFYHVYSAIPDRSGPGFIGFKN